MSSYSFTVFMSAFQLLPAAPFHIMAFIAWRLPSDTPAVPRPLSLKPADLVEWHILFGAGFGSAYPICSIPYFLFMEKRQWTTSALAPPA